MCKQHGGERSGNCREGGVKKAGGGGGWITCSTLLPSMMFHPSPFYVVSNLSPP